MAQFDIVALDAAGDAEVLDDALSEIFFETAAQRAFASEAERECYRHRWFDRYMYRCRATSFVALATDSRPIGYVVACSSDVRLIPCFSDVAYFKTFADCLDHYPAHLHVNVTVPWQGRGVGRALVERAVSACRGEGASGIHVVTAASTPAIGFYQRCGLAEVARRRHLDRELVMLARG